MLNDRQIKNAKPKEKGYKLNDTSGLYLFITPAGSKIFRFDFTFNGKRDTLTIDKYPVISLSEAREAADGARKLLANGISPTAAKRQAKAEQKAARKNTFQAIAKEWHTKQLPRLKANHAARVWHSLEKDVFPYIGNTPINELRVKHIKEILEAIAARGALETANKIRQRIDNIFNYALLLEIADSNPAAPLTGFIPQSAVKNMPALPANELTEFYSRLIVADVEPQNKIALMLIMLVFVRNGELRGGKWAEIDFQAQMWNIPAERMKRPRPHAIPLSDWAIELLKELHTLTGHQEYLFPSRVKNGFISENTLGKIINNMGYKGIATPHGFRSLASSTLNEQGFKPDAVERQLAHVENDKTRAAYHRADYMAERVEMMQCTATT